METVNDRKPAKMQPAGSRPPSSVTMFVEFYTRNFTLRFHRQPRVNWGKDGKLSKDMLLTYGLPELQTLLLEFFSSPDPFIRQSGYSIGVFATQINKLIVARSRTAEALIETTKTAGNVESVRRFVTG